jgi:hypothetical protein
MFHSVQNIVKKELRVQTLPNMLQCTGPQHGVYSVILFVTCPQPSDEHKNGGINGFKTNKGGGTLVP